jgi:hypothetical protein
MVVVIAETNGSRGFVQIEDIDNGRRSSSRRWKESVEWNREAVPEVKLVRLVQREMECY